MSDLRKAAQQALETMDYMLRSGEWYCAQERADALRDALAQPEPVWVQGPLPTRYVARSPIVKQPEQEPLAWLREAKRLAVEYRMAEYDECADALRILMAHLAGKPPSMQ